MDERSVEDLLSFINGGNEGIYKMWSLIPSADNLHYFLCCTVYLSTFKLFIKL